MKYFLFVFSLLCIFSCTDNQAKIKALETEVIAIHDEVMPKNVDINRLSRTLRSITKDTTVNQVTRNTITDQVVELTKAEAAMNTWMVEYKAPSKEENFEKAMAMLNEEKVKITKVKEMMLSSLKNGNELLETLKKDPSINKLLEQN